MLKESSTSQQINTNLLTNAHAASILHILLFQDVIQVSIMEFPIEEFALAFTFL